MKENRRGINKKNTERNKHRLDWGKFRRIYELPTWRCLKPYIDGSNKKKNLYVLLDICSTAENKLSFTGLLSNWRISDCLRQVTRIGCNSFRKQMCD